MPRESRLPQHIERDENESAPRLEGRQLGKVRVFRNKADTRCHLEDYVPNGFMPFMAAVNTLCGAHQIMARRYIEQRIRFAYSQNVQ